MIPSNWKQLTLCFKPGWKSELVPRTEVQLSQEVGIRRRGGGPGNQGPTYPPETVSESD